MQVKQLIQQLLTLNPEAPVVVYYGLLYGECRAVSKARQAHIIVENYANIEKGERAQHATISEHNGMPVVLIDPISEPPEITRVQLCSLVPKEFHK